MAVNNRSNTTEKIILIPLPTTTSCAFTDSFFLVDQTACTCIFIHASKTHIHVSLVVALTAAVGNTREYKLKPFIISTIWRGNIQLASWSLGMPGLFSASRHSARTSKTCCQRVKIHPSGSSLTFNNPENCKNPT